MTERLLTVEDAATMLGRTPHAVYRMVARRQLPYRKAQKRLVFVESELALGGTSAEVKAASRDLLQDNRATEVGTLEAGGAQYRIVETAATLSGERG